jgi:hypothetical protein
LLFELVDTASVLVCAPPMAPLKSLEVVDNWDLEGHAKQLLQTRWTGCDCGHIPLSSLPLPSVPAGP